MAVRLPAKHNSSEFPPFSSAPSVNVRIMLVAWNRSRSILAHSFAAERKGSSSEVIQEEITRTSDRASLNNLLPIPLLLQLLLCCSFISIGLNMFRNTALTGQGAFWIGRLDRKCPNLPLYEKKSQRLKSDEARSEGNILCHELLALRSSNDWLSLYRQIRYVHYSCFYLLRYYP
jgi:hypothetical protein